MPKTLTKRTKKMRSVRASRKASRGGAGKTGAQRADRRRRNKPAVAAKGKLKDYVVVVGEDRTAHVLVPLDEYEEMVGAELRDMVRSAIAKLNDKKTKWIDADEVARQLAGQRVAKARKAAGLTQKQLGEKLNLPQSQISRIERNPDRTTVRSLKRIARALGVDVRALV